MFNKKISAFGSSVHTARAIVVLLFSMIISACSTTHQSSQVIIEDRTGSQTTSPAVTTSPGYPVPSSQEEQTPETSRGSSPSESSQSSPTEKPSSTGPDKPQAAEQSTVNIEPKGAVLALLEQAEDQQRQGQNQQALTSLERAQRIAPRQPLVYLQLAQLHQDMGQTQKAQQFARKGLSLAGNDTRLIQAFKRLLP